MVQEAFTRDGFAVVGRLLSSAEVANYQEIYDMFLRGDIDAAQKRSDLGAGSERRETGVENITQIMWPSALYPSLSQLPLYGRALSLARKLLGEDIELDFDMLISKAPGTATPTPWHQDTAYWIDLPDKRAASFWVALDQTTLDSGCMWYVKGSHLSPLRPHWQAGTGGGALECECTEDEPGATPVPLAAGEAAVHAGGTLHYSRGNTTPDRQRRAYILNFRPAAMVALERERGMDHGLTDNTRALRNTAAAGDSTP